MHSWWRSNLSNVVSKTLGEECDGRKITGIVEIQAENFQCVDVFLVCEFFRREVTGPCRNEGLSFVLNEGGKEVPKHRLGLLFLGFFQAIDVRALVMRFHAAAV